jgi:hypothetical protein
VPRRASIIKSAQRFIPCACLFLMASTGHADWIEPLSLDRLAAQASLVVRGTVLSKSCQRDPAGRIYTKVQLDVVEVWKGSPAAKRVTIVHGGGILGDKRAAVSGQVEYGIGEEVVAFLVFNQRREGVTLGLLQGKFRVERDARTGELLAQNPFYGGGEENAARISTSGTSTASARLAVAELKRRVQGGAR